MLRVVVSTAIRTASARCLSTTAVQKKIFTPLMITASKPTLQIRWYSAKAPLTKKTLEERIVLVLSLYDKIDAKKLTMDSDFSKDLGLDSLDHVEVVMAMEEEFGFEIPDGDADRFKTPRDIFQYIADKEDVFE
uniref:Acyl carrier protein n=1 Tax=Caenorhabditis tropicalis TaxID=1561998 RepID=A0A1I7SXG8_9PELO